MIGVVTLAVVLTSSMAAQRSLGQGFLPHGYCFTWIPGFLWLNVISDVLIAAAYLSIPLTLACFVRHRTDLPFSWVFILFGVFIVACGATHALDVWTVWHADYWLLGGVKAITAAASVPTVVVLVWLMPKALSIPSAARLKEANDALREEVAALHTTSALLDSFFDSSPLSASAGFRDMQSGRRLNAKAARATCVRLDGDRGEPTLR
jgi:hypothetical protein